MKNTMFTTVVSVLGMVSMLAACSGDGSDELNPGDGPGGTGSSSGGTTPPVTPAAKTCREDQKEYTGLGNLGLVAGRVDGAVDANNAPRVLDRHRVKPNAAFTADLHRILGTAGQTSMDALLTDAKDMFSTGTGRDFNEPTVNAVSLSTAYRAAFRGCKVYAATVPTWAADPTDASAATECAAFQQKAWDITPTKSEIDACVKVATDSASFTAAKVTAPREKWAYMCASVLASTHFIAY